MLALCLPVAAAAGPQLSGFTVVTAPAGAVVAPLSNGYRYDLENSLSVRADPISGVASVTFKLDGKQLRTENVVPYAVGGDRNGIYSPWKPTLGNHTLVATPYSASDGRGTAGASITISLTVVDSGSTPTPTPTPTPRPTATPTPLPTATPTPTPEPSATPSPSPSSTPIPTPTPTPATSVTLAWNASTGPNVAGYHVSYGFVSGTYTQRVDVGNKTSALITGLSTGKTYYLAVSAYNTSGTESSLSNEVTFSTASSGSQSSSSTALAAATPQLSLASASLPGSKSTKGATAALARSLNTVSAAPIRNPGQPQSLPATTILEGSANAPSVRNLSTRVHVGVNNNVEIVGFTITGSGQKTLVVRALGPSLAQFGIIGKLSDPMLEISDAAGHVIASNNNWRDSQESAFAPGGRYHAFQPASNLDAAIALTLPAGAYSAIVHGKSGAQGVGLAEIYDVSQDAGTKLSNISTRAEVQTGENVLIGGLTVAGNTSLKVVLRTIGPSLTKYGITNPLLNPAISLYDKNGTLVRSADHWREDSSQANELMTSGYTPPDLREPAMILELPAGTYTAIVHGQGNTTGVALFDINTLN